MPVGALQGMTSLSRGLASGSPSVAAFLPDRWDGEAIAARSREVLARFRPRELSRADPALADLATGRAAGIFAGQQVGLFGGPLLTLVKALAAVKIAAEPGVSPAVPVFWCATEDHDLVEVTRFFVPGPGGPTDLGPPAETLASNRRPVGALPIDVDVEALLSKAAEGLPATDGEAREALRTFHRGATFGGAFVKTLRWLADEPALRFADAARGADKPDLVPLAARLVRERSDVRRILAERNAALLREGHSLQVRNDPDVLPLFALAGGERFVLREEAGRLRLKGAAEERSFDPEEVVANFERGVWHPSFSALTRPLAASLLYPVAATVLGPAEIAYWAQGHPLFDWAGILPPVLVPRAMVAPLSPAGRRALSRLGLDVADVLEGPAALASRAGAGRAEGALARLGETREAALASVDRLGPSLLAIDPALAGALQATHKNVAFALEKLEEKVARAAGRADETVASLLERLSQEIAPGGRLAERVYTAVPWLLRHGREGLVLPLKQELRWDVPGLQVIAL